ncbi:MAG: hypothetical protein JO166_24190 [Deltaproteobacteria bacterium]|nr:hypothetical protein [Deltaproteobacteria bacterium]
MVAAYFRVDPPHGDLRRWDCAESVALEFKPDALVQHSYGAVLVPPLVELPVPGDVVPEPMLPLLPILLLEDDEELGLVAELPEPLIGPEGEVALLSVAEPLGFVAVSLLVADPALGLVALVDPMLLLEPPAAEPLPPAPCAKAAGANAATDRARPAPSK